MTTDDAADDAATAGTVTGAVAGGTVAGDAATAGAPAPGAGATRATAGTGGAPRGGDEPAPGDGGVPGRGLLLAIDAPSLVYRAFFALPLSLRSPDGTPVNAVRGYLDMVARLLTDHRPAGIVHVLDADWRPAWRVEIWPGYKANRQADPPELPGQVPVIEEILAAAGMPVASAAGYEADDVLGTLAARATAERPVAVVTGDRDLFQVVRDPAVWVLFPRKGVATPVRYDEAAVEADYGIPPSRYADFAILRGDPSDGLPGLRGIGEKTARKLVNQFDSLDELVAAAETLPPRQAAAVRDGTAYLEAMRRIVPVATDVPVTVTPAAPPDRDRLGELAARYGIESPVRRLLEAMTVLTSPPPG